MYLLDTIEDIQDKSCEKIGESIEDDYGDTINDSRKEAFNEVMSKSYNICQLCGLLYSNDDNHTCNEMDYELGINSFYDKKLDHYYM